MSGSAEGKQSFSRHHPHAPPATVIKLLKRIGKAKVLPDRLLDVLRHAIKLLEDYKDALLVRPAAGDAQQRIDVVRHLLKDCPGIQDTAAALQCPLSDEVRPRNIGLGNGSFLYSICRNKDRNRDLIQPFLL